MSNRMTKKFGLSMLLMTLVATVVGCRPSQPKQVSKPQVKKEQPKVITIGVVREQLLEKSIDLPATLESDETAMLMARVEAYVDQVLVDIGEEVQAGQTLVKLSAPELVQAVNEARAMIRQVKASELVLLAELTAARSQLEVIDARMQLKTSERDRKARLVSSGAIARQLLEESEADMQSQIAMMAKYQNAVEVVEAKQAQVESELDVGQAKLEQAETLASYLHIKAPFAGVVAERNVDPGNLVRPASQSSGMKPLLVLAKVDKLRALVHATTDVAGKLQVGQAAKFEADDVPGKTFIGKLSRMAGTYNQKTRMMQVQIDLDNSPVAGSRQRPLRAGSYGSATIVLQSAKLPVVPESALRKRGDRISLVVVREGACLVTPVTVAFTSGELTAIAEGIAAGDQVVADPEGIQDEQLLKDTEIKIVSW